MGTVAVSHRADTEVQAVEAAVSPKQLNGPMAGFCGRVLGMVLAATRLPCFSLFPNEVLLLSGRFYEYILRHREEYISSLCLN